RSLLRRLLRIDVRDAEIVDQTGQELLLWLVEVALGPLLEHREHVDQVARGLEIDLVVLAVRTGHLAERDQRRRREGQDVGREADRAGRGWLFRHGAKIYVPPEPRHGRRGAIRDIVRT